MSYSTHEQLTTLRERHGPQEFGRICQALLERVLKNELNYEVRIRKVERPDIQAVLGERKMNIEVKAQDRPEFSITQRDLDGVNTKVDSDFTPVIAVLDFGLAPKWLLLDAEHLRPGTYSKVAAQIHTLEDVSEEVNAAFPLILDRFYQNALKGGSAAIRLLDLHSVFGPHPRSTLRDHALN